MRHLIYKHALQMNRGEGNLSWSATQGSTERAAFERIPASAFSRSTAVLAGEGVLVKGSCRTRPRVGRPRRNRRHPHPPEGRLCFLPIKLHNFLKRKRHQFSSPEATPARASKARLGESPRRNPKSN